MRVILVNIASGDYIPLALHYLKLYAQTSPDVEAGAEIEILEPAPGSDLPSLVNNLVQKRPDVVGFSCYIWNVSFALQFCKVVKEALPQVKIVLGGPELTDNAEKVLQEHSGVDVIVRGEGELTFAELLSRWAQANGNSANLETVDGLVYRAGADVRANGARKVIEDLDIIPSPYTSGSVDLKSEKRSILFESYRGCPFTCTYCFYPKDFGKLIHSFSLDRVETDLKTILGSGVKDVFLMDPTFNIPPKRAKRILQIIGENAHHHDLCVSTELRVDLLDLETIELLNRARIDVVEIGLESADKEVLDNVHRRQNLKKIRENAKIMKARNIKLVSQLIIGMPGDTREKFNKSIDFSVSIESDRIEAYPLQLLPGTPMYRDAKELGLSFVDEPPRPIVRTATMTEEEIAAAISCSHGLTVLYNFGIVRQTLRWLAGHLKVSFAELLDSYLKWRTGQATRQSPFALDRLSQQWIQSCNKYPRQDYDEWQREGNMLFDRFVEENLDSAGSGNGSAFGDVTRNLLKYEYYLGGAVPNPSTMLLPGKEGTPRLSWNAVSLESFDYNVVDILSGSGESGSLPEPETTWVLFRPNLGERTVRSFFNGAFREGTRSRVVSEQTAMQLQENKSAEFPEELLES